MCDPGWNGDMWNPHTPSGKPVGAQPHWDEIDQNWRWETEGERLEREVKMAKREENK